jgi:signal transduction histidine kinase
VLPEEDGNQAFYALLDDAIKQGRNCIGQELKVITRQGESIEVKLSLSLLKGDSGVRVGILATFKNLAEIQRLREHLQRADQLMTLGTMTAGIAHEIRNPLGSISGLLQLLREDLSEDVQKTVYIDTIMQATDRINNLIEDMLTLANPSLGRTELRAINEVLHETIGFARFDNLAKRIEIVEQYDNQEPIVHMDAERLGQAFLNIVRNAFQATPEGGKITVETHCKVPVKSVDSSGVMVSANNNKPAVCIRLNNTGSYIPPENYRQIFTPFFSTKKEGSGLGLSITRQIILAHGGSIEVESTHESGTTFIIELPFADQEPAAA